MVEYKVIITTSGLGSRLGNLTDYTNKALVRIGDKPAISYIIESYPVDTDFVITLGHYGSHIKQFLNIAYPNRKFSFVSIDKYSGEGSSLGYSLLKCRTEIDCPFIFHASDTILKDFDIPNLDENWVVGSCKQDSSQYRTLNINYGKLIKINEKGELGFDYSYVGLAGIKDYDMFFQQLEYLVNETGGDISDVHVINNMVSDVTFSYKHATDWFDIGNTTELFKTRKFFHSDVDILDKKDESIFFLDDFVIKFFYDEKVNQNRVNRARNLNSLVPTIISHTTNFYKYKKVDGRLFSKSVNNTTFKKFLYWAKENLWVKKESNDIKKLCRDFYINKTKKRIEDYLKNYSDIMFINGQKISDIHTLVNSIDEDLISDGIASQFHGDFILDNVIETVEGFCLIDWRQDFAGNTYLGDVYYDLAKLNHNLTINHDIVNRNLFSKEPDNCYILTNSILNECKQTLKQFIVDEGYDLSKVELLTSIIWLNMAPLHEYPLNNFLFTFGKYNLDKNINQ